MIKIFENIKKLIIGIMLAFIGLILLLILVRAFNVFILNPYKLKTEVIEEYEKKNVLLKRSDMITGFDGGFVTESDYGSTYWFRIVNPKQFKNNLFNIQRNKYGAYPLYSRKPNLMYNGQINYVITSLINDKNKGNDFSKIEEIINKDKDEILEKGFYHPESDKEKIKNRVFRFTVKILTPISYEYKGNKIYKDDYDYYILNKEKNILKEITLENYEYKEPEKYFYKMTRYSKINWEEYIEKNENLIFLVPYEELNNYEIDEKYYKDNNIEDVKSEKYMLDLFEQFSKYHNKETYRFAIL